MGCILQDNRAVDITDLWDRAHSHLKPSPDFLDNGFVDRSTCPACSRTSAVRLSAAIKSVDHTRRGSVLFCHACGRYHVPESEVGSSGQIVGVDARLWAASPTFLNLEPTTRCNFSCWYCVGRHMEQADIEIGKFVRILDNFPGLRTLALVGEGEPLMHKQFFEMVKIARDRGIKVGTISNGSTFSRSNIEKICESGINYISISIDSSVPEQFASSRLGGNLAKTLENIKRLVDHRNSIGSSYPKIGLKGTLFSYSMDELPKIVDLAKRHGVEIFESFQSLNPMCTYVPIYPTDKLPELDCFEEVSARIQEDSSYARENLTPIYVFAQEEGIEIDNNGTPNGIRPGCDEQWIYSLLTGDVTPCCQIKNPQDENWNLSDFSISEIQNDPNYQNLRFNLWNGFFPSMCRGCWKTKTAGDFVRQCGVRSDSMPDSVEKSAGSMLSRVVRFFK